MSLTHREEKILEAVIDGSSVPFDPVTRREKIFAKAAGEDIELAPPITKEEQILSALAAKGSGGGGSSDFSTAEVTFTGSTAAASIEGAFFGGDGDEASTSGSSPGGNITQGAVNLVLYKGQAVVMIKALPGFTFNSINATGNVQEMNTNTYLVTGDCNFEILS